MKATRFLSLFAATAIAATLAACGGGDRDGSDQGATGSLPEGIWYGDVQETGVETLLIVLEDGETWGIYSDGDLEAGALYGSVQGQGEGKFSGSIRDFDIGYGVYDGSFAGTFTDKVEITAIARGEEGEATIYGSYDDWYDQTPIPLGELAGTYWGEGIAGTATDLGGGDNIAIIINSAGKVTMAPDETGCSASGAVAPRTTGKNVFDLSVEFQGGSCVLETVRGIALAREGTLIAMAINSSGDGGFVYVGDKNGPYSGIPADVSEAEASAPQ